MKFLKIPALIDALHDVERAGDATKTRKFDNVADACPMNSFTGDTRVLTANGSQKRIKDVELGDLVISTDPSQGDVDHARSLT